MKIPFFVQEFTNEMEEAAIDALRNESFVSGESVSKFEEQFARYIGTKYAVSVNSGNSALQLSLMALDISNNSKVATPTNSFIASANCIRMTNARPILTDIDVRDGGIDIGSITEKVDAIVINAAAYTHTSIAIHDALKSYSGFKIELHISNPHLRETFRHVSYISSVVDAIVAGLGTDGYSHVIELLTDLQKHYKEKK